MTELTPWGLSLRGVKSNHSFPASKTGQTNIEMIRRAEHFWRVRSVIFSSYLLILLIQSKRDHQLVLPFAFEDLLYKSDDRGFDSQFRHYRSQWSRRLRRRSTAARLLGLRVRIMAIHENPNCIDTANNSIPNTR